MKVLDYLFAPAAFAGLLVAGWWGLYQSPQRPANLEAQLQQRASAALADDGHDWAHVTMRGQRAVLGGAAPSEDAVMSAADTLLHSNGPGGVVFGGVTIVESAVEPGKPVSPFDWRAIRTPDGDWVLAGYAPTRRIREQILGDAERWAEGRAVDNQMTLAAGAPGGNWQGVARMGLEILSDTDSGEARLIDRTLRVSAVVMDSAERARLSAIVANIAPPYRGQPLIKGPSLWTATHEADGLVLSGKVRTEAERAEIVSIAKANYAGAVIDRMETVGDTPDDWLDGVRVGLPHFARFTSGEMGLHPEPGDVGFAIEGEASGSTLQYLRQDMAKLGGKYPVNIMTDEVAVDVTEIAGIDFSGDPVAACEQAFASVMTSNSVTFETGSAVISRASGLTLDKLMAVSRQCAPDLVFELGGHTDSAGDRAANITLSEARAAAVRNYMADAGFDASRLSAIGYGPDQPAQSNDTAEGRAANRRIEFKVRKRSE
ncbi:MAG: OmpA family protein [Hyphomonas sp.]|uniref:OmpA family protein n=1 Tax=Hyphomonas sp. TaxID=87 RepID=UPI003527B68D